MAPIKLNRWMSAATRLTRQGRLAEATSLLADGLLRAFDRGVAASVAATSPPAAAEKATVRPPGERRGLLDRLPVAERSFGDPPEALGRFLTSTHTSDGMTRSYKLFVPSAPEASPALILMLHGCTQDPDDFAAGTRMNAAAEAAGFLVLYPRQSREANSSACWNWFGAKEQRGQGETAFLANLVRHVVAERGVDRSRVFVAGLSAGGAMAANLAATHPTLFAAAAIHSGLPAGAATNLPDALLAMRNGARHHAVSSSTPVPTIVFHGDADKTVNPSNAERIVESVVGERRCQKITAPPAAAGSPPFKRTSYLDDEGRELVELWELRGAGHAWAGGSNAGTYTDPKGVDATAGMLRFFDRRRR